jgi:hypothetical protein
MMANVTINNDFVFTAEARAKVPGVKITFRAVPLPAFLVQGDLVAFDEFGPFTFVVLSREFRFRSETQLEVTYLLDMPDDVNPPSRLRLVDAGPKQN